MGCGCKGGGMRNAGSRPVVGPRHNRGGGLRATQAPTPVETPITTQNHSISGMSKKRLEIEKKRREAILKKLGKR
jgi:hypothetical protein